MPHFTPTQDQEHETGCYCGECGMPAPAGRDRCDDCVDPRDKQIAELEKQLDDALAGLRWMIGIRTHRNWKSITEETVQSVIDAAIDLNVKSHRAERALKGEG